MPGRLTGNVAIVTGAGSSGPGMGNGKAAAILFAREGASVMCVDQVFARAEETRDLISAEGGQAAAFAADVSVKADCAAMVAATIERFGKLSILHNNVGIAVFENLEQLSEENWDRVMAVNVRGMAFAIQAAAPHLEAAGGGSIINISSIAGVSYAGALLTAYSTSKAAIIGLTLSTAGQLGDKRIRVNCIAPGQVYTPLVAPLLSTEARDRRARSGLIPDEGTAWDVAWAAVYFASDESRWVTGQVLLVDAGLTIANRDQPWST